MADKTTETQQTKLIFVLQRENDLGVVEEKERSLAFDTTIAASARKGRIIAFKDKFLTNYKWIIQPTNWRDDDVEEDAWECVAIRAVGINKVETQYDLGD